MIDAIILSLATAGAMAVAAWRVGRRFRPLLAARPQMRTDAPGERFSFLAQEIGLHRRLLRYKLSGVIHALVFVSFFVLLTTILQSYLRTFFPGFREPDALAVTQDLFAVLMLVGVGLALYNRFVLKPTRFAGSNARDAVIVLALIAAIVVAMQLELALRILVQGANDPIHPVAGVIAALLAPVVRSPGAARSAETVFQWAHIAAILGILVYIPGSKHLHMFVGAPNIFFRNREPRGRISSGPDALPPAKHVTELPWKGMLDLYSCTECGRCQSVCPAYSAGLPLSPKSLIIDLRDNLVAGAVGSPEDWTKDLAGGVIARETLWACTTCAACMQVCPLHIEHVPKIIDMRRALIDEGDLSPLLQNTLVSFQKYGNSFKKPARQRPAWTKELGFKIPDARDETVDLLWYVGDYASFHPLVQSRTRAMARLLERSGVSFGILYDREKNSGNDVRRIGEEGLYQDLAQANVAAIQECGFGRILTTDPHTLNTLLNEYRELGLEVETIHHTQLLHELMESGVLTASRTGAGRRATYHDPCYLGRYNGRFDAPRRIITDLGFDLHEMRRCRENSFCCGAGGGRIFMEDASTEERPSESRIREALEIDRVELFVVACPKDVVMYSAAVEAVGATGKIAVLEICDLFAETAP